MKEKIILTSEEKSLIKSLKHEQYTVEYLEKWLNQKSCDLDNVIDIMQAIGFYAAIDGFLKLKK